MPTSSDPLLSVVIVSYNTRELTLACLRAVSSDLESSGLSFEIHVVDNASRDDSQSAIKREFPGVHLLAADRNLGFGRANNRAFARARGEFLLLLNSDAMVHTGAIAQMLAVLRENAKIGGVGPRLLNADGSLQVSCWKFPSPARVWLESLGLARLFASHPRLGDYFRWPHDEARSVDFVIGACFLVRRAVYEQVGGFDEKFFLYAEETDWQKRIRGAGWEISFTPDAIVTHLGGASGLDEKSRVSALFWEGQERYILKHHGGAGWLWMRMGNLVGNLARALVFGALCLAPKRRSAASKARFFWGQAWRVIASRPPRKT